MESVAAADVGTSSLLVYAAAYAAMLAIPGPSFMIVSQASLSATRREAALVAIGVACGASLLIMLLLRGAANLPASQGWAELGRLAGTLLLLMIGFRALRRSLLPAVEAASSPRFSRQGGHFAVGLLTALTNPISFSFFSSVALTSHTAASPPSGALLSVGVFVMALSWFGFLAMLFSLPSMRSLYGRAARRLDGVMGVLLVGVALLWLFQGA